MDRLFLSKVDLSELDFSNVYLGYVDTDDNIFGFKKVEYIDNDSKYTIVFSDTNAKIDFSLCYAGCSESCDFSYTNLENSNYQDLHLIKKSSFRGCNLKNCLENKYICSDVDFSSNDMSDYELDADELFYNLSYKNIDLSNTGIHIYLDSSISKFQILRRKYLNLYNKFLNGTITSLEKEKLKQFESNTKFMNYFMNRCPEYMIANMIKKGYLDGCYLNDTKIYNPIEKKEHRLKRQIEHEAVINDLLKSVESQIELIRGK